MGAGSFGSFLLSPKRFVYSIGLFINTVIVRDPLLVEKDIRGTALMRLAFIVNVFFRRPLPIDER